MRFLYERDYPLQGPVYADLLVGNFLHNYFYSILRGEIEEQDADWVWEKIKENYEIFPGRDIRREFGSIEELVEYYSSLEEKIILWREEKDYIIKLRTGMDNAKNIAQQLNMEKFSTEKWIRTEIDGVILYGRVDILGDDEIIDIKTGNEWMGDEIQMGFYSLIYYLKNYRIPRARLLYLLSGKIKSVKMDRESLESLLSDVLDAGNKIRDNYFPSIEGEHCNFCPYRSICELSKREK